MTGDHSITSHGIASSSDASQSGCMKSRAFFPLMVVTLLAAGVVGCGRAPETVTSPTTPDADLIPITVQLDWVPEPEHGGFFQAQAKGWFREAGLDVTLVPGGANAFVMQKLATNQAQFGQADSTNTILAIHEGLPVIHVGAVFQNDPSVLMLHQDNPIERFEDLDGQTMMARPEWAFLPYLRNKYGIDFKIIPQNFQLANFIADPTFIQQGFYIAEPYHIIQGGGEMPKFLYAWDAGFDAYTVIVANKVWAAAHPDTARAFLATYIRGWEDYLTHDPAAAHALMKQANPNNTDEFMMFSRQMIIDERLVVGRGPEGGTDLIGRVSPERFATQIEQLETLGILPQGALTVDAIVTTDYLP